MRVVSDETKRKMSEAHKRRWADPEKREMYIANILETHLGAKRSKATRKQMSETHKARYAENPEALEVAREASKKVWASPDHRTKMAVARTGGVLVDDQGVVYADACVAAQKLGVSRKRIYKALKEPFTLQGQRRLCAGRILTRLAAPEEAKK